MVWDVPAREIHSAMNTGYESNIMPSFGLGIYRTISNNLTNPHCSEGHGAYVSRLAEIVGTDGGFLSHGGTPSSHPFYWDLPS